ncbi:MAG TPA: BlaI/MecI/CopY family transcriptional regulator [Verrucomicrobiae bacterium]|jgi:BlaI family penicillinase repressor|nr:BlaI/MecI/CopY family transcriptional regulator [Verrucomicrobiae bacterium]
MKKIPRISESEWEVMKVVWDKAPCSANQIITALHEQDAAWHPKTVKAFLNRLVKKKALGFKLDGRAYLYHPLVQQGECAEEASVSFLGRVFGGSLTPMLAHFVARKRLTAEEIEELKKLLDSPE